MVNFEFVQSIEKLEYQRFELERVNNVISKHKTKCYFDISEHLVLHVCIVLGVNDEARIPLNVMAGQVSIWDLNSGHGIRIPH